MALLEAAVGAGRKTLLIVAPDVSGVALNLLVANHMQPADKRKLAILAVKPRAVGDERRFALQDLAAMTGASVLGELGRTHRTSRAPGGCGRRAAIEFAGQNLVVTMEGARRSVIQGQIAELSSRLAQLPYDDEERPLLTRRLAALTGGIGILDSARYHPPARELRRAQALMLWKVLSRCAAWGVVAGGGAASCCTARLRCWRLPLKNPKPTARARAARARRRWPRAAAPNAHQRRRAGAGAPDRASCSVGRARCLRCRGCRHRRCDGAWPLDAADVVAVVLHAAVSGATMTLSTDTIFADHRKPQQSLTP